MNKVEKLEFSYSGNVWYSGLEVTRAIVVQAHGICFGLTYLPHEHSMDEFIRDFCRTSDNSFHFDGVDYAPPSIDGVYECTLSIVQTGSGSYEDPTPDFELRADNFKLLSKEAWESHIQDEWPEHWLVGTKVERG